MLESNACQRRNSRNTIYRWMLGLVVNLDTCTREVAIAALREPAGKGTPERHSVQLRGIPGIGRLTGRIIRSDKRGHIGNTLPPILDRLQITFDQWRINTTQFEVIHPGRFNRQVPQLDTG